MGRWHRAPIHRIGIQHPDLTDEIRLVKHVTRIMRIARANNTEEVRVFAQILLQLEPVKPGLANVAPTRPTLIPTRNLVRQDLEIGPFIVGR